MSKHVLIKCNAITFHTSAELFQVVTNTGQNSTRGLTYRKLSRKCSLKCNAHHTPTIVSCL